MEKNKIKKEIYAPSYYTSFKCIADKCRHSCCVDWEICIDSEAYERYKQEPTVLASISESDDGPCFDLRNDGRCPHLNDSGLCSLILKHGEDYLCDICKNHPRFFNAVGKERVEAGLGVVCEEACRIVLGNDEPFSLSKIGDVSDDLRISDVSDFDPVPHRDYIVSVIESDGELDVKLSRLKSEYDLPEPYTPDEWLSRFLSLEILSPKWEALLRSSNGRLLRNGENMPQEYDKFKKRLLTYFVYRHVSVAKSEQAIRARLAFSILSLRVVFSLLEIGPSDGAATGGVPEMLVDIARQYSSEIEYSEDNTDELIFAFESCLL